MIIHKYLIFIEHELQFIFQFQHRTIIQCICCTLYVLRYLLT